jgi:hypothetical protein
MNMEATLHRRTLQRDLRALIARELVITAGSTNQLTYRLCMIP